MKLVQCLAFVALSVLSASAMAASTRTVERVLYRIHAGAGALEAAHVTSPNRLSLIETIQGEAVASAGAAFGVTGAQLQIFYSVASNSEDAGSHASPMAVELRDASGKILAFRHKGMSQGETYWTQWLPGQMRDSMRVSWPDLSNAIEPGALTGEASESGRQTILSRTAVPADSSLVDLMSSETTAELAQALDSAPQQWIPFSQRVDWSKPGEYTWEVNTREKPLWAGYLWDFGKGQLWKGYRKLKRGKMTTPSQDQNETARPAVQSYYDKLRVDPRSFNATNSRTLSPLDKFGVWASLAHGDSTYGRDWKQAPMWEGINKHDSFAWGGYCNGSVSSSIMWRKPAHGFTANGIVFEPRDIVGLLQASNWVTDFIQMGYRCETAKCNKDRAETKPEYRMDEPDGAFSVDMLEYYLGTQGTLLAADLVAEADVGNEVIYKATLKISKGDARSVYANLHMESVTNFDDTTIDTDDEGVAPELDKKQLTKNDFGFKVYLKSDGKLDHTEWDDAKYHPDFFWLPTATQDAEAYWPNGIQPADGASWQKNPYLRMDWIRELHLLSTQ